MSIFKHLWISKFFNLIGDFYTYYKEKKIVYPIIHSEEFKNILSHYLFTNVKKDWIGRLYCIVNPNLDENGKFDVNRVVIEFDNFTTHNEAYVKNFIFKQLSMVRDLFQFHNLYNYVNLEIEKVGPASEDNYLVIISLVSQNMLLKDFKNFSIHTILYIAIAIIAMLILI